MLWIEKLLLLIFLCVARARFVCVSLFWSTLLLCCTHEDHAKLRDHSTSNDSCVLKIMLFHVRTHFGTQLSEMTTYGFAHSSHKRINTCVCAVFRHSIVETQAATASEV